MRLHAHDGYDVQVGEDQATFAEDRAATFQQFINEVPTEFKVLAQTQAPFRIIAPGNDPTLPGRRGERELLHRYAAPIGINAADLGHLRLRRRRWPATRATAPR